jgi:hypothetical protein
MPIDFAILAPVPVFHLESGAEVAAKNEYVSFGSMKWELFRVLDKLRSGADVPVLIYPSHEYDEAKFTYRVEWSGWYIGHIDDALGKRDDEKAGHRPPTTTGPHDKPADWAVFWRVRDLSRLPREHQVSIKELESFKSEYWLKNAPPRGPVLVVRPLWL